MRQTAPVQKARTRVGRAGAAKIEFPRMVMPVRFVVKTVLLSLSTGQNRHLSQEKVKPRTRGLKWFKMVKPGGRRPTRGTWGRPAPRPPATQSVSFGIKTIMMMKMILQSCNKTKRHITTAAAKSSGHETASRCLGRRIKPRRAATTIIRQQQQCNNNNTATTKMSAVDTNGNNEAAASEQNNNKVMIAIK